MNKEKIKNTMNTFLLRNVRFLKKMILIAFVIGNTYLGFCLYGNFANSLDLTGLGATAAGFNGVELFLGAWIKQIEKTEQKQNT